MSWVIGCTDEWEMAFLHGIREVQEYYARLSIGVPDRRTGGLSMGEGLAWRVLGAAWYWGCGSGLEKRSASNL